MAFSNTVLPNVAPVGPGGTLLTSQGAVNSLSNQALQNKILSSNAQYAPYENYADTYLKMQQANWLPYQQRMQALSNPMLWVAAQNNPGLQNQLMGMMSNPMNSVNGSPLNIPVPQQSNNPLLSLLGNSGNQNNNPITSNGLNQVPGIQSAANPIQQNFGTSSTPVSGSPLVPASSGGVMGGLVGKMMAPYNESPYKQGETIADPNNPGEVISVPTSKMATQLQNQISASQRTIPQLQSLPKLWEPFFGLAGHTNLAKGSIGNFLSSGGAVSPETLKSIGLPSDSDLPSQFQDAKTASLTSVESYLKSIGVPVTVDVQDKLNHMIEPAFGENERTYSTRIQNETQRIIKDFVGQTLNQLKMGYSSSPSENPQIGAAENTSTQSLQDQPEAKNNGLAQVNLDSSGQQVIQATKNLNGKTYVKLDGKWHPYG